VAIGVGAAVIALVLALAAFAGAPPAAQRVAADSPLLGKRAPTFSLVAISGHTKVSTAAMAGHTVVVNFWASWCVECQQEAPTLEAFYRHWHRLGVEVVGISSEDSVPAEQAFARDYGVTFPLALDDTATVSLHYGVFGIPETYVISPAGIVVAKLVGRIAPGQLDQVLNRLTAGSGPISASNPNFVPAGSG
jgi:cytochrome c biogenesis protein CcmG/thiol:disulfide interchange protein DsbE